MTHDLLTPRPGEYVPAPTHNTEATSSGMRFWARAIGDRNRRYVSDGEVRDWSWGTFEAHPCWLYSVHDTLVAPGHPQLVPVLAHAEWEFARPVREGDQVRATARILGERTVEGRHAGTTIVQEVETEFVTSHLEPLARVRSVLFLMDPARARRSDKYAGWSRTRYTEDQLLAIEAAYDAEDDRGTPVRYVEDVAVGDELPGIVRGPVTSEEMTMFVGATHPVAGGEIFTRQRLAGLVPGFVHPRSQTYETYAAGSVDDESAQQLGFPAAHDLGIDRIAYGASLLTSWMGPRGHLVSYGQRLIRPVMLGDTSWCRARVLEVNSSPTAGRARVVLETTTKNQLGETTARGRAEVDMDSRGEGLR